MATSTILKRMLVLFCVSFFHFAAAAQSPTSHWVFSEFGLEFQDNSVSVRHDFAPIQNRGAGIISSEEGDLLLYSDGFKAWNSQHDTMPNGGSLLENHLQHSIHESMVLRWPGSETLFLIFTADPYNGQEESGLYYSLVDLSLDGGLGDVTLKGEKLLDTVSNKITAVLHNNRRDIWLITHKYNTNNYYAYLISDAGITDPPVISAAGPSLQSSFYGQLKASPDGRQIACSHEEVNAQQFVLFDFDDLTGILSNPMSFAMPAGIRPVDGIEFSSDAKKLLVYQTGSSGESGLYQFDLSSPVYQDIQNSRTLLIREQYNSFAQMQLAENGSIYLTKGGGGGGTGYLGVIHNPNDYGAACQVTENGLDLEGASAFVAKTPNFNQSHLFKTYFTLDHQCQAAPISFKITNEISLDSVRWDFGEGSTSTQLNPVFTYSESGAYTVQLLAHYALKTDTISRQITIDPEPSFDLGNDTTACPGLKIGVDDVYVSYLWNTGETYHIIYADTAGSYILSAENIHGCSASDTIEVTLYDLPEPQIPDTVDLAGQDSVQLDAGAFQSYEWSTGESTQQIYVAERGWYSVLVENANNCRAASSVYITDGTLPEDPHDRGDWEILNPKPSLSAGNELYFLDDENGFIVTGNELLRTRDGGDSWDWFMELSSGRDIAFSHSIGYIVGAGGAVYKSTHEGEGWNKLSVSFSTDLNSVSVLHPDTVRITGDNTLIISNDGGQSWDIRAVQGVDIEASYFTSADTGHIACRDGSILKTTNGGSTWYTTESVNHTPAESFDITFVNAQLGFASRAHSDLLRTTDGGESWALVDDYLEAVHDIFFIDENAGFVAGGSGSIFRTVDGGITWEKAGFQSLIGGTDLYGIHFINKNKGFVVGQRGQILQTTNAGESWEEYAPTYNTINQVVPASQNTLYALGLKLFKSLDDGQTWDTLNTGIYDIEHYNFQYTEGQFFSSQEFYAIASAGEVSFLVKSTDGGQNFETVLVDDKPVRATSIHFLDMQNGWVCNRYTSFWSGLHKTSDGGLTWIDVSSSRFQEICFVNEDVGFGIMADQLYQTGDGGYSWEQTLDLNLDLHKIHFLNDTLGFITGEDGLVLKTTDQGLHWQEHYTGTHDNYGICFIDPYTGFVTGEYNTFHNTYDGGNTWESRVLPALASSVAVSGGMDIYVAGPNGVILKNNSELDQVKINALEAEQKAGNIIRVQAIIYPGGRTLSPVYFSYGINGMFSDSVLIQAQDLDPTESQLVYAELAGLERDISYSLRVRAHDSGSDHYSDTITFMNQTISSIPEDQKAAELTLYPNPAKDILHLNCPEHMEHIQVYDIHGKVVISGVYQSRIDISKLEPGQYFIRIRNQKYAATGRFLKE